MQSIYHRQSAIGLLISTVSINLLNLRTYRDNLQIDITVTKESEFIYDFVRADSEQAATESKVGA